MEETEISVVAEGFICISAITQTHRKEVRQLKIAENIKRDVDLLEKEAQFIIYANEPDSDNVVRNNSGRLSVIAVIGSGSADGRHYEKSLLCEVGIHKVTPYHLAARPKGTRLSGETFKFHARRKLFQMSREQYLSVAPKLFSLMQEIADQFTESRPYYDINKPWPIRLNTYHCYQKRKPAKDRSYLRALPKGIKFRISLLDKHLVCDAFWAEMNANPFLRNVVARTARKINKAVRRYQNGFKKKFNVLAGVNYAKRALKKPIVLSTKPYLARRVLNAIPDGERHPLFTFIASDIINCDKPPEREETLADASLPDRETRINGLKLLVTTGLGGKKLRSQPSEAKGTIKPQTCSHITVEVYHSRQKDPFEIKKKKHWDAFKPHPA